MIEYIQFLAKYTDFFGWVIVAVAVAPLLWIIHRGMAREWGIYLISWVGLAAAAGFWLWLFNSAPSDVSNIEYQLSRYPVFLLLGAAVSGIAALTARVLQKDREFALLSYTSCIVYFGFLKVIGWSLIPWITIALVLPAFMYLRRSNARIGATLLLLQCMGTVAGLYMSFHLQDFLGAWEPFKDVVGGMWLLITDLA